MIFVIAISGIVVGMIIMYLYYQYIPRIKNEHWVDGYNEGIRDYYKADQWANKMMEGGFWDDDIDWGV